MFPEKMKPKSLIPNQDGFKFIGIDKQFKEHYCIIRKEDDGCYYMNSNTCVFSDLQGWVNDSNK